MPKKSAASRPESQPVESDDDGDDDDDDDAVYGSGTQSQALSLSSSDIRHLANNAVHYILTVNQKGLPIKRTDIVKHVLKRENVKYFKPVVIEASKILLEVFGLKFLELEKKKSCYILINNLVVKDDSHLKVSACDYQKQGLLFVILAVIFMNNNIITEAVLINFLKRLGIEYESRLPHEVFGDVKKLITQEFVRQQYLVMDKVPGSDPLIYEFKTGERAEVEISKREILEFVCHIYDGMKPEQWSSQYKEVLKEEGAI